MSLCFAETSLRQSGLEVHLENIPIAETHFAEWKNILTEYFSSKTLDKVFKNPVMREKGMILDRTHK
ncbi:hypothetical protein ACQV5M_15145 [Leptospira sp. SA-E8]|uniref:hypothetical protein n=1 Tax=Leptospira sp. SA-E8 TaxID=3422259 RepID=UPI003EB7E93C